MDPPHGSVSNKENWPPLEAQTTPEKRPLTFIYVAQSSGGTFHRSPPVENFVGNYQAISERVALGNPKVVLADTAATARTAMYSGKLPQPCAIGTAGIAFCIGVYFEIDDSRFFIAHFETSKADGDEYADTAWRESVKEKLAQEAADEQWPIHEQACSKRIRDTLLLVCFQPTQCNTTVMEAIREWTGCQYNFVNKALGFVVTLPTGEGGQVDAARAGKTWILRHARDSDEDALHHAGLVHDEIDRVWYGVQVVSLYRTEEGGYRRYWRSEWHPKKDEA